MRNENEKWEKRNKKRGMRTEEWKKRNDERGMTKRMKKKEERKRGLIKEEWERRNEIREMRKEEWKWELIKEEWKKEEWEKRNETVRTVEPKSGKQLLHCFLLPPLLFLLDLNDFVYSQQKHRPAMVINNLLTWFPTKTVVGWDLEDEKK